MVTLKLSNQTEATRAQVTGKPNNTADMCVCVCVCVCVSMSLLE